MADPVVYRSGAQIIKKFTVINTDFPSNGIHVADSITIGIDNPTSNVEPVDIFVTFDSPADIEAGTANWLVYQQVLANNVAVITIEYGPVGLLITTTGTTATAWVKS